MAAESSNRHRGSAEEWLRHQGSLQGLARAILGDEGLAADAVQGAFLSAMRGDEKPRNRGWWKRAVRNRALDVVRERERIGRAQRGVEGEGLAPSTEEVVQHLEMQRRVLDAVQSLEERAREVIFLRYFRGEMPKEIAQRLDVPVKTVKTRLARALEKLRRRLAAEFSEGGARDDWRERLAVLAIGAGVGRVPATGAGKVLGGVAGALVMKKLVVGVCVVVLVLVAGYWGLEPLLQPGEPGPDRSREDTVVGEIPATPATPEAGPESRPVAEDRLVTAPFVTPSPATLGALRVAVSWPEGDPASGVGVVLRRGQESDQRSARREVTDAAGVVHLSALAPGTVRVGVHRGSKPAVVKAEVAAGETAEVAIRLDRGVSVHGVVRTKEGFAMANAAVWLTARSRGWLGGRIAARSDIEGRFRLRHVPPNQSLGAFADGWAPSELVDLDTMEVEKEPVTVELLLHHEGAGLNGVVVDHEARPVAGARVILTSPHPERVRVRQDMSLREQWGPRSVETDTSGRFAVSGLLPGKTRTTVLAVEHPAWEEELVLEAGTSKEVRIVLVPRCTVHGVLTDARGGPVIGGTVYAFREPIDETFLMMGQVRGGTAAGTERVTTDEAGRFRLARLTPGVVHLYAQDKKDPGRRMGTAVLFAKARLTLEGNEERRWDPRLAEGGVIHGTVSFSDGVPMKGVFLSVIETETRKRRASFTEDGRFRFVMLAKKKRYDVRVQLDEPPPGTGPLVVRGVEPGGPPLKVVADFPSPDSIVPARVLVRFEDRAGRIEAGERLRLSLESVSTGRSHRGSAEGDRWSFEVRHPDRVVPLALAGDRIVARGTSVAVTPGKDLDLGTLSTGPGGSLRLRLQRDEATRRSDLHVFVGCEGLRRRLRVALGTRDELELSGLEPGPTTIKVIGMDVAAVQRTVMVTARETAELSLTLEAAIPVPFRASWNLDRPVTRLDLELRREDGSLRETRTYHGLERRTEPLTNRIRVPVGRFLLRLSSPDGRRAEGRLAVTSLDADPPEEVRLELR